MLRRDRQRMSRQRFRRVAGGWFGGADDRERTAKGSLFEADRNGARDSRNSGHSVKSPAAKVQQNGIGLAQVRKIRERGGQKRHLRTVKRVGVGSGLLSARGQNSPDKISVGKIVAGNAEG